MPRTQRCPLNPPTVGPTCDNRPMHPHQPKFAIGDRVRILDTDRGAWGKIAGTLGDLISVTRPDGDRTLHPPNQLEHLD
ncbi:Uncharacterised protein [Gordonia bronchialis]|nr:Uncharacterised protein [Gordonia bronchialis]